jgi:hypothetical protein
LHKTTAAAAAACCLLLLPLPAACCCCRCLLPAAAAACCLLLLLLLLPAAAAAAAALTMRGSNSMAMTFLARSNSFIVKLPEEADSQGCNSMTATTFKQQLAAVWRILNPHPSPT